MLPFEIKPLGDESMIVEFGEDVSLEANCAVLALASLLDSMEVRGMYETQPTFRSLLVRYEPLELPPETLIALLRGTLSALRLPDRVGRLITLPVCYDPSVAPDLERVAAELSLTPAQLAEAHSAADYHVYMLGFLPGQPYLGQLPETFALPRRRSPRVAVPAGSVGIAMRLTSIFPATTPCGWHIVGRCPTPMWSDGTARCQPGDRVRLRPLSLREYEQLPRASERSVYAN